MPVSEQETDASLIEPQTDASAIEPAPIAAFPVASPGSPTLEETVDAGVANPPNPGNGFDCSTSAQRFLAVVETNCVMCHGRRSRGAGNFTSVLDIPALISSGKIVPGEPDNSPLFRKLSSGAMPPAGRTQRPTPEDVETIRGWIDCGAPNYDRPLCQTDCTSFVDIPTRLRLIVNDLEALNPVDARSDVRYLDLTNYANAGYGEQQLELYRDAISYAVNSLSRGPVVVLPQAVDDQALLYRIRLSDYGWTQATWQQLVAAYPYDVSYDADSRSFPIDDAAFARVREQTGTLVPYVQADWFFSHAVRPPLYYDLLGAPASLGELEAQLGITIADDIANQRVARAGFHDSGASHFNRVIERHELSDNRGVLWLTYDFDAGTGFSNVITHPLDFRHTSSQILFSLANGLHAYMIVDNRGARLDKAPNGAVQDPASRDLAIESGISCTSCHLQTGVSVQYDEVRDAVARYGTDVATTDAILALYKPDTALDALFDADRMRYQTALAATRIRGFTDGSAHQVDAHFTRLLSAKDIAAVLGIEETQLLATINASPSVFPPEALALRVPGSTLARDSFEAKFTQFVVALGLGVPQPR